MAAGTRSLAVVVVLTVLSAQASPGRARISQLTEIPPPPAATDSAFDAAFQCPESLAGDAQRLRALVDYFHWVQARHPDWSVADAVEYKKDLLVRHQCAASLRDLDDFSAREWSPPSTHQRR
jgi:hypothetical protein